MLFAFLVSTVLATIIFAAWQADRANLRTFTYDGVVIAIGVIVSVPVQIAVLSFAARLRRWTPANYLGLNRPRPGEIVFAVLCTIALMIVFDLLLYVSGRDLVPPFQVEAYQTAKDAGWLLGLLLAIVVVAPIGEEVVFRGFLYRGLVRPGYEMAGHRWSSPWPGRCSTSSMTGSAWRRSSPRACCWAGSAGPAARPR